MPFGAVQGRVGVSSVLDPAGGAGGGDHGFPLFVKSKFSQQLRSDGTSLAVVHNIPLRSIALRVGGLPTGTSVSHSCDRKVPMVF